MKQFQSPPGATPIYDCSGLKLSWISTQEELNSAEAENISSAQSKYLSRPIQSPLKWFNTDYLIKINKNKLSKAQISALEKAYERLGHC